MTTQPVRRPPTVTHTVAPPGHDAEVARLRAENEQLRQALCGRAVIDQALGMVMALTPCSRDDAWALLVRVSQHSNTKLRTVCEALVATTGGSPLPREVARAFKPLRAAARTAKPRPDRPDP
jgi:hypothetical protein